MKNSRLAVAALTLALGFGGCAQADDDDTTLPADTVSAMPAPEAAAAPSAAPVVVKLDEVDDSNISGEATATHSPTDVTVAIVLKEGGQAATSYPAHIHTGTCAAGGPVAVELTPVTNLQSTTTVALSSLPADQKHYVQAHNPSGKPVACGDMTGHGDHVNPATSPTN